MTRSAASSRRMIAFYKDTLFNAHWGEQIAFRPDNVLEVAMVFQGLNQERGGSSVAPFPRLARRFAGGLHSRLGADDPRSSRPEFLGP